jgi:O-antigen/teichoic acid export membrane protein
MRLQVQSVCLATLPIVLVLIGFAEPLAGLFGAAFAGLPPVIALLAIAAFTQANNMSIARTFDGIGRRWAHCGFFVVWGCVFVAVAIALIPAMGALGMAAAYAVAEATMLVLQALYVDVVLMPGLLRGNAGVFAFAAMLLAAGYLAHQQLPAAAAMAVSVVLCAIGLWPIASKLRTGKRGDSVKGLQ